MGVAETERPARYKWISSEKRWLLFVFTPLVWVVYMVFGIVLEADRSLSRVVDLIGGIAINFLTFAWCRIDSAERGYDLHRFFPIATIVFGFLPLLYYLFRSRGLRGGMTSTGWFVLYVICCITASSLLALLILLVLVMTGAVSPNIFSD